MQFDDHGIILSARKHSESNLIVRIFTREHGVVGGLVRSVKKHGAVAQAGNLVECHWNARLEEHLGNWKLELARPVFAQVMGDKQKLSAVTSLCTMLQELMAERDPHPQLYDHVAEWLTRTLHSDGWLQDYVQLELDLLSELGFGLDLTSCAVSGVQEGLAYVSPKSGRAVTATAGAGYEDKLLALPAFLHRTGEESAINRSEVIDGLRLTRYFLERWAYVPLGRSLPEMRHMLEHDH